MSGLCAIATWRPAATLALVPSQYPAHVVRSRTEDNEEPHCRGWRCQLSILVNCASRPSGYFPTAGLIQVNRLVDRLMYALSGYSKYTQELEATRSARTAREEARRRQARFNGSDGRAKQHEAHGTLEPVTEQAQGEFFVVHDD